MKDSPWLVCRADLDPDRHLKPRRDPHQGIDAWVHFAELEPRYLRLLHTKALRQIALREVMGSSVADDCERDRPTQRCSLPLGAKLRIVSTLCSDQLLVGLRVVQVRVQGV